MLKLEKNYPPKNNDETLGGGWILSLIGRLYPFVIKKNFSGWSNASIFSTIISPANATWGTKISSTAQSLETKMKQMWKKLSNKEML